MTIRVESRITIAGSVGEVWAYVCDVRRWPEWAPTVVECWVRGGGPVEPGAWVDQRAKDLGRAHARSQQVTAVEAPRFVAFAGRLAGSASRWAMELEPVQDSQTDALMWIEVDLAGMRRAAGHHFRARRRSPLTPQAVSGEVHASAFNLRCHPFTIGTAP